MALPQKFLDAAEGNLHWGSVLARGLTAAGIEKTKPSDKRQELPDGIIAGLYLVVQPSGKKSFALRYRHSGRTRKLTLGRYPALSLKDARLAATAALEMAGQGNDPATQKQLAKSFHHQGRSRVSVLLDDFERRHLSTLRSGKQSRDFLNRFVLKPFGNRDIGDIKKRDIIELLDSVVDSGRGTSANRVLAHFRKFLNWCVERDIIEVSPAAGVKAPAKENIRHRVLSDNEIRLFWKACDAVGQPFGQFGKMLLLTGQRRGEVGKMTETEIDGSTWHLSADRTKNKRAHDVPLSSAAITVVKSLMLVRGTGDYIFTTTGDTPVSGYSKARSNIAAQMVKMASDEAGEPVEIPDWIWHDLRRTCETGMSRLRVSQEIIDRVTNHISGQHRMVRTYNQNNFAEEKREALDLWAQAIEDILAGIDPVEAKLARTR